MYNAKYLFISLFALHTLLSFYPRIHLYTNTKKNIQTCSGIKLTTDLYNFCTVLPSSPFDAHICIQMYTMQNNVWNRC